MGCDGREEADLSQLLRSRFPGAFRQPATGTETRTAAKALPQPFEDGETEIMQSAAAPALAVPARTLRTDPRSEVFGFRPARASHPATRAGCRRPWLLFARRAAVAQARAGEGFDRVGTGGEVG